MKLVLDTNVLSKLCHPTKHRDVAEWLGKLLADESIEERIIYVPEIADYELRRELLRMVAKQQADQRSIDRLDDLGRDLDYSPISTSTLREACRLWATARNSGNATSSKDALDGDVILAAQALELGAIVITSNRKHLSTYGVTARDWSEV